LSGPILAQPILDEYLHNTFFVVAHFHLIMAMAGVFGLLCATYYWYPLMFGRQLSEPLGKIHFWCTLAGAYSTFLPMHLTGLGGEPRHYAQLNGIVKPANDLMSATMPMQRHITYSALLLALSQVFFLWNLLKTARQPALTEENPWQATTLEWAPASEEAVRVYREPCQYDDVSESFLPQWRAEIPLRQEAE
jgi:cytochrome c oxidase subunit 1